MFVYRTLMVPNGLAMSSSVPQGAIAYRYCWAQLFFLFIFFFPFLLGFN